MSLERAAIKERIDVMDYEKLANLLFHDVTLTIADIEERYSKRNLPCGAPVTRIAPSPTGFIHLGNLYNAIIAERLAHQHGGAFYLRIEDTDAKREVPKAVDIIISSMKHFGIEFDEGAIIDGDSGDYGPYRQRQRKEIYQVFAKELVRMGLAYPCFCTEEHLNEIREMQKDRKEDIGYYGTWATCRNLSIEQIEDRINAGTPYVLRYRGDSETKELIHVVDAIRGELTMPANRMDFVLLKSDGIPTYHFAHVIDDHFMQSTYIIRGEEWISSLPIHIELFHSLGWKIPIYCHTATLMKMDGVSKRKLSKRKDPELALEYYNQEGYCPEALWIYILTILNSNFEEWRQEHEGESYLDFPFTLEKMSSSGALFDLDKLNDISKDYLSKIPAKTLYALWLDWAKQWNREMAAVLINNKELAVNALNIGRLGTERRKDLITWKQATEFMSMYFDETYQIIDPALDRLQKEDAVHFLEEYLSSYRYEDEKQLWFDKLKQITSQLGFAVKPKDYKKQPDLYRGSIVDLTNLLRIALTGRANTPDLWEISNILGDQRVRTRIQRYIKYLE